MRKGGADKSVADHKRHQRKVGGGEKKGRAKERWGGSGQTGEGKNARAALRSGKRNGKNIFGPSRKVKKHSIVPAAISKGERGVPADVVVQKDLRGGALQMRKDGRTGEKRSYAKEEIGKRTDNLRWKTLFTRGPGRIDGIKCQGTYFVN